MKNLNNQEARVKAAQTWLEGLSTSAQVAVKTEWNVAILKEFNAGGDVTDEWCNDYLSNIFEATVPQTIFLSK